MSEDTVRVAVRIRPLIKTEIEKGCQTCVDVVPGEPQIQIRNTDKAFRYNYVFSPDVSQEDFYNNAVKGLVDNIFRGYNVTILAYGQTGSGKTHSMGTDYNGAENLGVIPRAVQNIFNIISSKADWSFSVTVSFMELYQEQLYDLLSDKQRHQSVVDIREGGKGIQVVGITEKEVTSAEEALRCLTEGSLGRATGATAMNAHSSRSHAIFTLSVHQQKTDDPNTATIAKFHLVDLAGSERSKKTQATGERFKEGVNINKGLLALGNVISQLGEGGPLSHISYRDSKLTRLLQDSLGGNSMTLMIACVSPADYNLDETLSTLRYADRALKIKNKPIVNQDPRSSEINRLNKLVQELKLALVSQDTGVACPPEHQRLQERVLSLQQRIRDLTEQINGYLIEIVAMHERAELAENTREKVQSHMEQILADCKQCLESLEAGLTEDKEPYNELKAIYLKILGIHTDQKKASEELLNYDVSLSSQSAAVNSEEARAVSNDDSSSNSLEEFDVKHEEHTLRQAERNNEVMNINRELAIKESLVCKLLKNSVHIVDQTKELQEMEHEIKTLQAEKEELVQALQNAHTSNASSKLAEARRKKVQELEKRITELSRKCTEQSKVIKAKEKQDQQIKSLSNEIHQLKQTRVKLVRQMRCESDKFTRWKQCREKELNKLREQDRKRMNEMTRLKMQHDRQETVFKRKMEEAFAVNKRLKEALDLQKRAAQSKERASNNARDNLRTWLNQELEILISTVDAESSLQKLMQDRASLTAQLEKVKGGTASEEEIAGLTEFLELRNAQITDLQQKILDSDQENRSSTRFRSIHSMAEAKSALRILFEITAETRRKECEEIFRLKEELQAYKERCELQERRALAEMKMNKGEKYLAPSKPKSRKPDRTTVASFEVNQYPASDDSYVEDDVEKDPDWTRTPLFKRLQKLSSVSRNSSLNDRKRSSDGDVKCACKTNCSSRLCSCRKNFTACGNCNCNPTTCQNRDKENLTRSLFVDNDDTSDTSKRPRYEPEKTFTVNE